jgi:CubicO group peptidase (beta-lactamase class C family)
VQLTKKNSMDWQSVVDIFAENQAEGDDGASLALVIEGELVLSLAAGVGQNRALDKKNMIWSENTLVNVFSAGKGLVAICVLQLVQQGKLQLDRPIADYWPEFGQFNKNAITVRQVLTHRSGLSAFHQPVSQDQIYDWQLMTDVICNDEPWWQPDSAQGYSPFMYGWILGELVRRVAGVKSFNDYFQEHVAAPLNVDCFFGVPQEKLSMIVDTAPLKHTPLKHIALKKLSEISSTIPDADSVALGRIMKADPRGVTNRAFSNPISLMTSTNSLPWRQAQIPAANAHTNALGLAKIYGDLVSSSSCLLEKNSLQHCWQEQTFETDKVLGLPLRFACGFMLSQAERIDCCYGRGAKAFGHPGAGGSLGFADPEYQLGFGYITQRMGQSLLIDRRAIKLIDAIYTVLEQQYV